MVPHVIIKTECSAMRRRGTVLPLLEFAEPASHSTGLLQHSCCFAGYDLNGRLVVAKTFSKRDALSLSAAGWANLTCNSV
jgi:hypothetical protein